MRTLIKNGTVVTAADTYAADLLVEDERIAAIVAPGSLPVAADREIDARGQYVMPGGIDVHTHLDMPFGGTFSSDDFESGTIAAAFGGTTTIVDFANQKKGGTLRQGLDAWHAKAEGKAAIDYGFHMIVTDVPPPVLAEMADMVREGVTSFKLFQAYPNVLYLDDGSLFRAIVRAAEVGALVSMHAENGLPIDVIVERNVAAGRTDPIWHARSRPEVAEATATERAFALAEMAGAPMYIVHLTNKRALHRVMEARDRGLPAFAETCPQYIFCTDEDLKGREGDAFEGAKFVCSPPLRPHLHAEHLWRGLATGALQTVATDHCPFNFKGQKELGRAVFTKIPNGLPAIETRLHLIWEGVREKRITMNRFVEVVATNPAKLFGLYPRKGSIAVGADADLILWDPEKRFDLSVRNLHMRCDYSLYEGKVVVGAPTKVLSRGELIVDGEKFLGRAGRGRYLRRSTFSL